MMMFESVTIVHVHKLAAAVVVAAFVVALEGLVVVVVWLH